MGFPQTTPCAKEFNPLPRAVLAITLYDRVRPETGTARMTGQSETAASGGQAFHGRFNAEQVTCVRGEKLVFQNLDFVLESGGALVLRGPNGSGKSSLLRIATGLLPPEGGALNWNGENIEDDPASHRARLHYVSHQDPVKPAFTVQENLEFWAGLHGHHDAAPGALADFGIEDLADVPARFLSSGQRRRLNLSRVASATAALWLLDEPTVGLDDLAVEALRRVITAHRARGGMVMLATHLDLGLDDAEVLTLASATSPGRG